MSNITDNIKKIIIVNPSERSIFLKLLFHSFLIGLANSFFLVQASGNFITKVSLTEIPIAYIFSGILGLFIVQVFKKMQLKYGNIHSYKLTLYFFAISISIICISQIYFNKNIFLLKLFAYVGFELIFVFLTLFSLGFNSVCNANFSFSQSKRLIALLGTGEVIASIIGILIIPVLKKFGVANNDILIIAVIFSLFSLYPLSSGQQKNIKSTNQKKIKPVTRRFNIKFFLEDKYVLFLSITAIISVASYYFIDYSYMVSVRYLSALTSVEIVNIVAFYLFTSKLGELFFSIFSKNIIYSIGTKTTLLLQPFLLLFFALFGIFCFFIFPSTPIFIVIFLLINKWVGTVIRKNITVPVRKLMLQMNGVEEMNYLQNNIEGLLTQLSTIFCGILLYLICIYSDVKNYQTFTIIITSLNLIIFILYFIFNDKLYQAYRVQIQIYLNNLYNEHSGETTHLSNRSSSIFYNNVSKENEYFQKIDSLIENIDFKNKEKMISLITYYNPTSKSFFKHKNSNDINLKDEIFIQLKKLYFENQNYFSRYVLITYIFNYDLNVKISFLKDIYNLSDLSLNAYLLNNICKENDVKQNEFNSFFAEKLNDCIVQILWTESAVNDLNDATFESLTRNLQIHKHQLTEMLLSFLELMSDKKTLNIVKNIFNKVDKTEDDLIFIVELLENILSPELKKTVLPIFEPISYNLRANKLSSISSNKSLTPSNRLSDILMYNYNIINSYIKELALNHIMLDNNMKKMGNAFKTSQIPNLKSLANITTDNETDEKLDDYQIELANQFCKYFSLDDKNLPILLRWGFRNVKSSSSRNDIDTGFNFDQYLISTPSTYQGKHIFEIDLIAPYLLSKMSSQFNIVN